MSLTEIVDTIYEIILVVNQDGDVLFANKAAEKIRGQTPGEIIGKKLNEIIVTTPTKTGKPATQVLTLDQLDGLAQKGVPLELSLTFVAGVKKQIECRVSDILWEHHKAYLLALHDITDIRRIAQLTAEIKEKSRIDKLKDEFISIVSHEMRTPLTIIKGAVSNLKDGIIGPMTDKQLKVLDTTNRNVDRLARIINDLLDLSRLESGKAKIIRRKTNIKTAVDEVVLNFQNAAMEKNIAVLTDIPLDLPPVFADNDLIHQVLTNLVNNALRYAKQKITVQVVIDKDQNVRVGVIDDGEGIPKDKLGNLFNKFEQINRPTGGSGYKGTGLGLAISKQIITLHQGHIWADSDLGLGARFYFSLPVYHENDDFLVALENVIATAEKNKAKLSLLIISLSNMGKIADQSSEKDIAWMFADITREIRNKALRKSDFMHFKRDTREFVVMLPDTERDVAKKIAERVHNLTKDCFCPGRLGKIFVTLHIGVAVYPDDAHAAPQLLEKATKDVE